MITQIPHFQHPHRIKKPASYWFFLGFSLAFSLLFLANLALFILPANRLAPGTKISHIDVGWLSREQATKKLSQHVALPEPRMINLSWEDKSWKRDSSELKEGWAFDNTINTALSDSQKGSKLDQWIFRWNNWFQRPNYDLTKQLDTFKTSEWVSQIAEEIDLQGERPRYQEKNNTYTLIEGKRGREVIQEEFVLELVNHPEKDTFEVPVAVVNPPLSADGQLRAEKRLLSWKNKELIFIGDPTAKPISFGPNVIIPSLSLPEGFHTETLSNNLRNTLQSWERPTQDAEWKMSSDQTKLENFVPHQTGRSFDWEALTKETTQKLLALENSSSRSAEIVVTFKETQPLKTLKEVNDLGVEERIGFGVSSYEHSIPNRIFNVGLTSSRVNYTLVKPGEEFSFNNSVGEISRATGYKTAYVIKDGITQLGDGGGVCQVSTTVFRAALNAGLPITRWKAHSYRVGYYEQGSQPGFDATVYSPSTDFRFMNDTEHAIVVTSQADEDNQHMVVEIWGKSDGRKSTISDYSLGNQRPPPPTLFVDDPTLPRGTRKQIDFSAPGATTRFTYTVHNRDGSERLKKTFVSNFAPWRAVYLVGTL